MINLLVADDHAIMRQALCEMLQDKGEFNVMGQAENGLEVLNILQNKQPDIIIMDAIMPELDGIETIKAMSEKFKNSAPPVLILSANDKEKFVRSVIHAGAKGFVPKNAKINELMFAISSILEGKTYLSPSVTATLFENGGNDAEGSEMSSDNPLSVLTKRELEITKYLANGLSNREIGKTLHISIRTVDTHRSNILHKLNIRNNADLVRLAIANRLIEMP